ncbi:MAG TPA: sigma-70 family RNA polymerase sigma factor [Candidatus Acidoferrales bacterium]|nr:sigma-70 family RNA polymerase sigma factor [Candidatus Acidoferrales bacterium]
MSTRVERWLSTTVSSVREEPDFATLLAENQRRVFQIAHGILGSPADAEEVAQEAFLRAHHRFASLRDPAPFRAWIGRIAFRLALNRHRARRRQLARETAWQATRPQTATDPTRTPADHLFLDRLRSEIDLLPEKLRTALLLSAVEGMDAREVTTVLDIPVGTVRSRLHLARKRLLEVMKP